MIKTEFWSSKTLARVSRESRLLFIGLWNHCDDFGYNLYNLRRILGEVFPYDDDLDEKKVKILFQELLKVGLVVVGQVKEKAIFKVISWDEHQKVNHPSGRCWLDEKDIKEWGKSLKRVSRGFPEALKRLSCPKEKEERERRKKKEEREREPPESGGFSSSFFSFFQETKFEKKSGDNRKENQDKLQSSYDKLIREGLTGEQILNAADLYAKETKNQDNTYTYGLISFLDQHIHKWIRKAPPPPKEMTPEELAAKEIDRAKVMEEVAATKKAKEKVSSALELAKQKVKNGTNG